MHKVRHIESKDYHIVLCGNDYPKGLFTFLDREGQWITEPTCETCILLHFSNPKLTYKSRAV